MYTYRSREVIDSLDSEDLSAATFARLIDTEINDESERRLDFKDRKDKDKRDWVLQVSLLV